VRRRRWYWPLAFPQARSYADIGAGTGAFAAELQRRDKVVVAYERSRWGQLIARSQRVDVRGLQLERVSLGDLVRVDVALCFEVAEHLRPDRQHACACLRRERAERRLHCCRAR
jgi:2-polyprenyl-3-methyl-5-hydroxy-6-metoxy-1,4-benzoquinol methylase